MGLRKTNKSTPAVTPDMNLDEDMPFEGEVTPTSTPKPKPTPEPDPNEIPKEFGVRSKAQDILDVRQAVSHVCSLLRLGEVPNDQLTELAHEVDVLTNDVFDEDFNTREELVMLLRMVKASRSHLMEGGRIKEHATIQEVKAILDASMKLTDMLNKANQDLINIERIQAIEASFLEAIQDMDLDVQKQYLDAVKAKMEQKEALKRR